MKLDYIKYAFNNLLSRKMRSWLNVLSILIGIAAIFALVSFGEGLKAYTVEIGEKMGTDKIMAQVGSGFAGSPLDDNYYFTDEEIKFLEKVKGVDELVPMTMGSIKVSNEKKTFYTLFMAWEPGLYEGLVEEVFTVDLLEGRTVRKTDKNKVTVGYNYLVPGRIFKKPMKRGDIILVNDVELEIVGFYDAIGNPQDDSQIYTNIETYLSLFPQHEDQYKFFFARSNPNANPAEVADKMEKKLMKKRDLEEGEEDFSIQTFEQAIKTFGAVLNIINSVLVLIALISVIVAAVNIMNTMYTAVLERTKEIGIMKAVGATRGIIMTIFVIESGTLGLVGSGLGALIGFLIASAGGAIAAGAGYPILKPVFPAWLIIGCLLFGFLLGAISGLMPARQAAKLKPVDSLHYE